MEDKWLCFVSDTKQSGHTVKFANTMQLHNCRSRETVDTFSECFTESGHPSSLTHCITSESFMLLPWILACVRPRSRCPPWTCRPSTACASSAPRSRPTLFATRAQQKRPAPPPTAPPGIGTGMDDVAEATCVRRSPSATPTASPSTPVKRRGSP